MGISYHFMLFVLACCSAYAGLFAVTSASLCFYIAGGAALCSLALSGAKFQGVRAIAVLMFLVAMVCGVSKLQRDATDALAAKIPAGKVVFEGTLSDLTPRLDGGKDAWLHSNGWLTDGERHALALDLRIAFRDAAAALQLRAGDVVRIRAEARTFERALAPGTFDPYLFGLARGISGTLTVHNALDVAVVTVPERRPLFPSLRASLRERLLDLLTPREAGLILALLIGDTKLFDDDEVDIYRRIGAGHLLAVSGLQVTLFSVVLYKVLHWILLIVPFIGRRSYASMVAALLASLWVLFFVGLCGATPSALRAALMAEVVLLAQLSRRQISLFDAFSIAGLITVLVAPASLVDPSFLLSYAAVFGLFAAAAPKTEPTIEEGDDRDGDGYATGGTTGNADTQSLWKRFRAALSPLLHWLNPIVLSSIGAGLMTMPISAALFGEIVPISVVLNMFIVPIASVMQFPAIGFGLAGIALNSSAIARVGANAAGALEALADGLQDRFGFVLSIPAPTPVQTASLMVAVTCFTLFLAQRRWLFGLCCMLFLGMGTVPFEASPSGLRITSLAVGQGDSTVVEFPSGQVMLIDGGGSVLGKYDPGKSMVTPFLLRRRVRGVDVMVVSHPDPDHLLGLLDVLRRLPVKEIWHPGYDDKHFYMRQLIELANEKGVPLKDCNHVFGEHRFGDVVVNVLAPRPDAFGACLHHKKVNDNSLVLLFKHGKDRALWPGDIEEAGEAALLKAASSEILNVDVMKAAHHGSKTSSTSAFVRAASPTAVIFSTGQHNQWGFPHEPVVARWAEQHTQLFNTAVHGEIVTWLTGNGIKVLPYRQ